jgi:hypothetical protein
MSWSRFWRCLLFGGVLVDIDRIRRKTGGTFSGAVAVDLFRTYDRRGRAAWLVAWGVFGWHIGWGRFVETPEWARR